MKKIVVLGCATTGMTAASRLKRINNDFEIVGYQKLSYPSLGACGLPYYVGNNFDNSQTMIARTAEEFQKNGIKINLNCEAIGVDFKNCNVKIKNLITNQEFIDNYDELIISTGARPRALSVSGVQGNQVFNCYTIEDADRILSNIRQANQKVCLVGAGLIGLELATNLRESGHEVFILESESRVASRLFDQEITNLMEDELRNFEIKFYKNTKLYSINLDKNNNVTGVTINDNNILKCDVVIVGVGVVPNTNFLINKDLKLDSKNAIIIDDKCQTNISNVFAGGDCAITYNYLTKEPFYSAQATVASKQGKVIADIIANKQSRFQGCIGSAMVKLFNLEVATTGLNENMAILSNINYRKIFVKGTDTTNYVPGAKPIVIKLIADYNTKRLLGAQIVGYNKSVLRIGVFTSIIWSKLDIREFKDLDLPYAPPFNKSTDISNIAIWKLIESLEDK